MCTLIYQCPERAMLHIITLSSWNGANSTHGITEVTASKVESSSPDDKERGGHRRTSKCVSGAKNAGGIRLTHSFGIVYTYIIVTHVTPKRIIY
jgi:hypothetical protein